MSAESQALSSSSLSRWLASLTVTALVWFLAYSNLTAFADAVIAALGLTRATHAGEAVHFFVYDTPKVLLLLAGIVFVMGIVQTFFAPERTRALLSGKRVGVGNVLAATLGIVTPFCSCSAVPLFIGFLSAGVPLGVTFSFLIAAPMVNEVALVLLFGMFGWKVAAMYLGLGLLVAIVAGFVIGKLKMEGHLEDWVQKIQAGHIDPAVGLNLGWVERFEASWSHVKQIVGKVWPYILLGIGLGAAIHGYVPEDFMASFMGKDVWWAVPAAVVLGVPMYTNAAGIIPIVEALIGKGAALGTVLAFMMAVIALSAPENDHPPEGAQATVDRHVCRCRGDGHPARRLSVQCDFIEGGFHERRKNSRYRLRQLQEHAGARRTGGQGKRRGDQA